MADIILMHESDKCSVASAKAIIYFFIVFPDQKAALHQMMSENNGVFIELVQEGETRSFLHNALVLRLFKAQCCLE